MYTRAMMLDDAARYRKDAAEMANKAHLHAGMPEEAHYLFFARTALLDAAHMEDMAAMHDPADDNFEDDYLDDVPF